MGLWRSLFRNINRLKINVLHVSIGRQPSPKTRLRKKLSILKIFLAGRGVKRFLVLETSECAFRLCPTNVGLAPPRNTQTTKSKKQHNPLTSLTKSMKKLTYSIFAAALACGFASATTTAYTTPVGYVTTPIPANVFTFVGLTVHNPTISAGVLASASATPKSVTVTGVDFVALLGAPGTGTYILELADGTIQEIINWTAAGVLDTVDNITGKVVAGTTTYKLRKASTVSDVFGATNSAGLKPSVDGDYTVNTDVAYVFVDGALKIVYYYNDGAGTTGWYDADGNPAANYPLVYADGFYVKRVAGSTISLVTTGEVKQAPTSGIVNHGWNFLSSVAPAGLTLGTSGLQNFITPSADGDYTTNCDNVYLYTPALRICYYFNDGAGTVGWYDADGNDATGASVEGAFLILDRGATKPYTLSVPASYTNP